MALIGDVVLAVTTHVWARLTNRPYITCDMGLWGAEWWPDSWRIPDGRTISGITMRVFGTFMLANNGPVDTAIKDLYVSVKYKERQWCRLSFSPKYEVIRVGPRDVWKSGNVEFDGFIPGITELPKAFKCELIVKPVAQRRIRKKVELPLVCKRQHRERKILTPE